ncbi:MAG TPA: type I restriction-modification enzyme R subunit C-terminal domain-containing protein [Candidatus Deferrimicrobium sp.]|nr:type I restriction-modification enzyme R subunit C-terminal domain-containing protein [Candidatus Deferrimicrobium sp.]
MDMLTTGVDIPAIEMIVFMRMVKSRILWVQMLGRGTRLCPGINKEKFTIIDCFDGTLIEYFKNATDFDVNLQNDFLSLPEIIDRIYDNMDREYYIKILIKRLRRIEKNIGAETREKLSGYIPEGDLKSYTDRLKENLEKNFSGSMKLLRNKDFQELLINYPRPKRAFLKGYEIVDTVKSEIMFGVGSGYQKAGDYLTLFETFVKENPVHIEAIEILLSKPGRWNPGALDELRKKLEENDFAEENLQKAHDHIYKKPLADIISMIKHASDLQAPILTARERVKAAMNKMMKSKEFSEEQETWLGYIEDHLIENLAIGETDFETMQVFERRGGLGKAKKVFGDDFNSLINQLNEALAA